MNSSLVNEARSLPLSDRVELIDALWESIVEDGYEPSLTPEQTAELKRRLDAHRRNPDDVVSCESIKSELAGKYTNR